MRYFIRSIKYFFYFALIFILIMAVLVFLGVARGDLGSMFRGGYNSLWQIGLLFAAVAAIYPKFGFTRHQAEVKGEYSEIRQGVIGYMEDRGYKLESENGENLTFRLRSKVNAIFRMLEDRISLTRNATGFEVEGLTKDVIRITGGLGYKFKRDDEAQ